ncbi:MerR family DNA-binding transcriptional regulator [Streptomyces lydicus]|uniref:MerR family transcriptional regulator n=1 Tax=Streptomyces lydicus TaxID=47763 RepID=UPI00367F5CBE
MAWPTAEVARMSGVTARTLRHYDEIGLLPPAWVGTNGHRYVQAEIDAQYRALTGIRAVSTEEYRALGRSCVENEPWRAAYESIAPGLAAYQRDAILAYATTRLS